MPINSRFRKYKLRAGITFDYFDFYDPILSAAGSAIVVDDSRFFSYHFESTLNTENDFYTPTRGIFFTTTYTYRTDNLLTYQGNAGISEVRTIWRNSFALSPSFTLSPCLFGRLVFSEEDTPLPFANAIGSYQSIVDQQLAFPGVHSLTYVDPLFVAAQLRLQFNLHKNQYLIFRAALQHEAFRRIAGCSSLRPKSTASPSATATTPSSAPSPPTSATPPSPRASISTSTSDIISNI